jgi:carbamoylphosphate synthase large subunit
MQRAPILITSVGSLVGWTLLAALHPLRPRLTVIGCNSLAASPSVFDCDRAYRVPGTGDVLAYRDALRSLIQRERPRLVLPGRDEELPILAELAADPACRETRMLAPPGDLVPVFNDKLETARFAARAGLPFAATAHEAEEIAALVVTRGFPLVVKPRFCGHASKEVRIVANAAQLQAALAPGRMLVQECLNPDTLAGLEAFSPDTGVPLQFAVRDLRHAAEWLVDDAGDLLSLQGVVSRTEGALSMHMRLTDVAALTEVATGYARALAAAGQRGVANLQGKLLPDGRFVPFELNGRFTGSAAARAFMGCNQVARLVSYCLWGETYAEPPCPADLTTLRAPVYREIDQSAIEQLETRGYWTADMGERTPGSGGIG